MWHAGPDGLLLFGPPTRTANDVASAKPYRPRKSSLSSNFVLSIYPNDVRFWHNADIPVTVSDVRFWG
jgi:hypothetical protein